MHQKWDMIYGIKQYRLYRPIYRGVVTTGSAETADPPPPTFWSPGSSGVRATVFQITGSVDPI